MEKRCPQSHLFPGNVGGAREFDKPQIEGDDHLISGWALIFNDALVDGSCLRIEISCAVRFTPIIDREKRDGVAKCFNYLNLLSSGYSARINKSDVPK